MQQWFSPTCEILSGKEIRLALSWSGGREKNTERERRGEREREREMRREREREGERERELEKEDTNNKF